MGEGWKDFWKTNRRGEYTLKGLMLLQPIGLIMHFKTAYDIQTQVHTDQEYE